MQLPLNTMQMYVVLNLYAITLFFKKTNKSLMKTNFKYIFEKRNLMKVNILDYLVLFLAFLHKLINLFFLLLLEYFYKMIPIDL